MRAQVLPESWMRSAELEPHSATWAVCDALASLGKGNTALRFDVVGSNVAQSLGCWHAVGARNVGYYIGVIPMKCGGWKPLRGRCGPVVRLAAIQHPAERALGDDFPACISHMGRVRPTNQMSANKLLQEQLKEWRGLGFQESTESGELTFFPSILGGRLDLAEAILSARDVLDRSIR